MMQHAIPSKSRLSLTIPAITAGTRWTPWPDRYSIVHACQKSRSCFPFMSRQNQLHDQAVVPLYVCPPPACNAFVVTAECKSTVLALSRGFGMADLDLSSAGPGFQGRTGNSGCPAILSFLVVLKLNCPGFLSATDSLLGWLAT